MSVKTDLTRAERAEVKRLEKQIVELRNRIYDITTPVEEARARTLVGRCYRYEDGYGSDQHWTGYIKVLRTDQTNLVVMRFAHRTDMIELRPEEFMMPATLERYEEISPAEFDEARTVFRGALVRSLWPASGTHSRAQKKG